MVLALAIIVLGAILIYGGVEGYSITSLLQGKLVPRNPINPEADSSASGSSVSVPSGLPSTTPIPGGLSSPIASNAQFERIDQGVDFSQSIPYSAIGSGTVTRIATGWAGGTGQAVYVQLDNPITINGSTYNGYYYAETSPLVKAGQKVKAGQAIASAGAAEIGFLINGEPTPLVGGLGSETKPTKAGQDFYSLIKGLIL